MTYSLTGTVMQDGEKCRWIELNEVALLKNNKEHVILRKYLISEKDLLESERPLDSLKRGWMKVNDRDVRDIKIGKENEFSVKQLFIFPGIWLGAKNSEDERVVDYQHGRLK